MVGGDGCRYVGVDLLLRQSQNCRAWGLRARYHVGCVYLEKRNLVSCGGGLDSYCVDGGYGCSYAGVNIR